MVIAVALAAVATVAPSALEARDQCNTGSISCCNSTMANNDTTLTMLSSLLGLSLPSISGLIGLNCSPLTSLGFGTGAVCTQQPVCCSNNNSVSHSVSLRESSGLT
ncbi:fungal hydrophobin [Paxillus involutus ATCC 200175]|nr:fungal hydrophobin [Paxillus involutus ATCC 200175]